MSTFDPSPSQATEATVWLVSLESMDPIPKRAFLLIASNGSNNDVREIARCRMGRNWSTSTFDRTSMVGPAGMISKINVEGGGMALRSWLDAAAAASAPANTPTQPRAAARRPR